MLIVEAVAPNSFEDIDVAFFSAGATRSREFAPHAVKAGALVIDNSSAFRMDPDVPLVVPEINASAVLAEHRIIAVPNCSAIILLMASVSLSPNLGGSSASLSAPTKAPVAVAPR